MNLPRTVSRFLSAPAPATPKCHAAQAKGGEIDGGQKNSTAAATKERHDPDAGAYLAQVDGAGQGARIDHERLTDRHDQRKNQALRKGARNGR